MRFAIYVSNGRRKFAAGNIISQRRAKVNPIVKQWEDFSVYYRVDLFRHACEKG